MVRRCHDDKLSSYRFYGARGVTVCDRWRADFNAFAEDVGARPSREHTIDRIRNDLPYQPGNIRWATMLEQEQNRENNIRVEFNGETLIASEWARRMGLKPTLVVGRLRAGWSPTLALTTPPQPRSRRPRVE